jgi:hypothetical protein
MKFVICSKEKRSGVYVREGIIAFGFTRRAESPATLTGRFKDPYGNVYEAQGVYDPETGFFTFSTNGSSRWRYTVSGAFDVYDSVPTATGIVIDKNDGKGEMAAVEDVDVDSIDGKGTSIRGEFPPRFLGRWYRADPLTKDSEYDKLENKILITPSGVITFQIYSNSENGKTHGSLGHALSVAKIIEDGESGDTFECIFSMVEWGLHKDPNKKSAFEAYLSDVLGITATDVGTGNIDDSSPTRQYKFGGERISVFGFQLPYDHEQWMTNYILKNFGLQPQTLYLGFKAKMAGDKINYWFSQNEADTFEEAKTFTWDWDDPIESEPY